MRLRHGSTRGRRQGVTKSAPSSIAAEHRAELERVDLHVLRRGDDRRARARARRRPTGTPTRRRRSGRRSAARCAPDARGAARCGLVPGRAAHAVEDEDALPARGPRDRARRPAPSAPARPRRPRGLRPGTTIGHVERPARAARGRLGPARRGAGSRHGHRVVGDPRVTWIVAHDALEHAPAVHAAGLDGELGEQPEHARSRPHSMKNSSEHEAPALRPHSSSQRELAAVDRRSRTGRPGAITAKGSENRPK